METSDRVAGAPATVEARLFDRPDRGERALLVQPEFGGQAVPEAMAEWVSLAESAGAEVAGQLLLRRSRPVAATLLGSGQVESIREQVEASGSDLVLVNHMLSPTQERNLERILGCRVLDRTGLILDIFASRARSHEGKLQVELAQLRYLSTRLVRGWSHLERQKGGIGLRGPGETQLELDRRMLSVRIRQIEQRLVRVGRQREQGRQSRRKRDVATVSLVGYTNAGKSTLFNALTEASVYADDRLFATLDTTLRRLDADRCERLVLADTVGFIRQLPHTLVAAFRSTLEEVTESALLLHVIDASDPGRDDSVVEVERVLEGIGAGGVPVLMVYNKVDLAGLPARVERNADGSIRAVHLSAVTGAGLDGLRDALAERLGRQRVQGWIRLQAHEGRLRALLFASGGVRSESTEADGSVCLELDLDQVAFGRIDSGRALSSRLQPEAV